MTLRRVHPGEPLKLSAAAHNAWCDAAEAHQARQLTQVPGPADDDHDTVLIRNDSGADRNQFEILGIGGFLFLPSQNLAGFKARPSLVGVVPSAGHAGRFAVLLEPIPAGRIGEAAVFGAVPCQVTMNDTSHKFADAAPGDPTALASAEDGPATILAVESGTGPQWAYVRLGGGSVGEGSTAAFGRRATLAGDLAAGGSAQATLYVGGQSILVYDWLLPSGSLVEGTRVSVVQDVDGVWFVVSWSPEVHSLVTDVAIDEGHRTFLKKTRDFFLTPAGVESDWTVYHTGGPC
ncbi:MAG: hypothetical protein JW818_09820 [Pirellulales bacterium]|nr:hypothetical protein [Pirellulales bacterium]